MEKLDVKDVTLENIDDLINLCIPNERKSDSSFVKGANVKRKWAVNVLKKHGNIGKLAFLNSRPVGLIQYQFNSEEKVVEIGCIFVPDKKNLRKGIGKSLFKAMIEDAKKPQPLFHNNVPLALVTWAFQVPEWYPQNEFYQKLGFKRVSEDDPFLLYYPLKEGYIYRPKEKKYVPQEADRGKALIFYDPSCPFAIHHAETIAKFILEVAPNVPIRMVNKLEEIEEVKKRGQVGFCSVNGKNIQAFFMDKENFQREIRQKLDSSFPT